MANEDQAEIWNDVVGGAWVDHADDYDALLERFGLAAIDRLAPAPGERLLDIGCGTGATTLTLADRVAPGTVLGVDLSAKMLTEAQRRAGQAGVTGAEFRQADVQTGDLGRGDFDAAFSRVGVMFFEDPAAAFTNVAGALKPGGRLAFICFQGPEVNPVVVLPVLAAAEVLSLSGPSDPTGPGPFSLADPDRTAAILTQAGFIEVTITEGPDQALLTGADDLPAIAARMLAQNPLTGAPFAAASDADRRAALDAVVGALEPYRDGDTLHIGAGTWIVSADTPG